MTATKSIKKWTNQADFCLFAILLLALFWRAYALNSVTIGDDETYEYHRWVHKSFQTIAVDDLVLNSPTLAQILARASILGLGDKLFALRWPAVFISVLGVAIIYKLTWRLFDRRTGLVSALLLSISPFAINYAHSFRGYSSVITFPMLIYLLALLVLQTNKWRYWLGLGLVSVVTLYSHLFTFLSIFNVLFLIILVRLISNPFGGFQKPILTRLGTISLLMAVMLATLYMPVLSKMGQSLVDTGNLSTSEVLWTQRPTELAAIWTNLLWFNGLQHGHYGHFALYPFLGLTILGFWLGWRRVKWQRTKLLILLAAAWLPFLEIWILGQILTNFWVRPIYLSYTLPPLLIIISLGITYWSRSSHPPLRWLLAGLVFSLIIGLSIPWFLTLNEYFSVATHGNWQPVGNFLRQNSQQNDLVICQQYTQPWRDEIIDAEDDCTRTLNYRRKADSIPMATEIQISHEFVYKNLPKIYGGAANRSGRVWLVIWDIPASINLDLVKAAGGTITEFNHFGRSAILQVDSPRSYTENLMQALLTLRLSATAREQKYLYSLMIAPLAAVNGQNDLAQQNLATAADNQLDHPDSAAKLATTTQLVKTLTPPSVQNRLETNFGDEIMLLGYNLSPEIVRPASSIKLTFFWKALKNIPQDYAIFLHVRDQTGRILTQSDYQPFNGGYSTRYWQPGQSLVEERELSIPADLLPGQYNLVIGLYNQDTMERLPLLNDSSGENAFLLTHLMVQ